MLGHYTTGPRGVTVAEHSTAFPSLQERDRDRSSSTSDQPATA